MSSTVSHIKCPHCYQEFSVESVLENDLREKLRKEYATEAQRQQELYRQKELELVEKAKKIEETRAGLNEKYKTDLAKMKKEQEEEIRKQTLQEYDYKLKALEEENKSRQEEVKLIKTREFELQQREKLLKERAEAAEMEMKQRFLEKEEELKKVAEENAEKKAKLILKEKENELSRRKEEFELELLKKIQDATEKTRADEQMKAAELQKQLDDQKKLVEELRKKTEQGSMQLQGEVQELALEEMLKNAFPYDTIDEVAKGVRGADAIQTVRNNLGQVCGKIIYESKRTKAFGGDWIEKLKTDMRAQGADVAVIVTETMPRDMDRFGMKDGVWICSFVELRSVALVLRDSLIKINAAQVSQENKGDKMQMLYNFLTGNEFRQQMDAIVEGFTSMHSAIIKEKMQMEKIWKEREKQLEKVLLNATHFYGSIKGIAGSAVADIELLSGNQNDLLPE